MIGIILILLLVILYFINKPRKIIGGTNYNDLDKQIENKGFTNEQKLSLLTQKKTMLEDKIKTKQNNYLILANNLTSSEEQIKTAEHDLEDLQNELLLANTNINLKKSIIELENDKNDNILKFNVLLLRTKQYNIYSIILMNKTKKIRENHILNPEDAFFKNELSESLNKSVKYSKLSYDKINELHNLSTSSSEFQKYTNDLQNSKMLSLNLMNNILSIEKRFKKKENIENEIKSALSLKNNPDNVDTTDTTDTTDNVDTIDNVDTGTVETTDKKNNPNFFTKLSNLFT